MSHTVFSRHPVIFRRFLVFTIVLLYFLAVLVVDRRIWPGHNLPIFYVVPILVVALSEPPWFVAALAFVGFAVNLAKSLGGDSSTHPWPFTTFTLGVVGTVAVLIAIGRRRAAELTRRSEQMIDIVQGVRQPITVIIGRSQLARRFGRMNDVVHSSLVIIERSARRADELITKLLTLR